MPAEGAMGRLRPGALALYVLTSGTAFPGRSHEDVAGAAIDGGASAIQLRAPELDDDRLTRVADAIAARARDAGVRFLVNDRVDVARASGADGAHVGQADAWRRARDRLGPELLLGVSVGNVEEARAAEDAGADYLAVTVWSTPTKPEAVPTGLDGLRAVAETTTLPVVGIGGIDAGNARDVLAAGAAGVAVIGAVAGAPDPIEAARELRAAVDAYAEGR
jgi:thiamine-phosphate pyrophosphorylase